MPTLPIDLPDPIFMQPVSLNKTATHLRPRAASRVRDCITIRPHLVCAAPLALALGACDAAPSDVGVLACTATRECINETCTPSDLEFNIQTAGENGFRINFVDSSFRLDFVETTLASSPEGEIRLTTYENQGEPLRLTLAQSETDYRARLILQSQTPPRDISATCVELEGARS